MVTFPPLRLAASISSLILVRAANPSRIPPTDPADPLLFGVTGEGVPGQTKFGSTGPPTGVQPRSTIKRERTVRCFMLLTPC
jgi:hypothetical protein